MRFGCGSRKTGYLKSPALVKGKMQKPVVKPVVSRAFRFEPKPFNPRAKVQVSSVGLGSAIVADLMKLCLLKVRWRSTFLAWAAGIQQKRQKPFVFNEAFVMSQPDANKA